MLSRRADYGVRAMLDIALQSRENRLIVSEIAERQGIPVHFLAKIVPRLAHAGLLHTSLGAGGGVILALPADQITLLQIIEAIDGPMLLNLCSIDSTRCSRSKDCAVLNVWCNAQVKLNQMLAKTNLSDLIAHQRRLESKNKSTNVR